MASLETTLGTRDGAERELVERARALTAVVRERATATDEQRKLPPETIEDLKQAGIIRALAPERFGGLALDPEVTADVAMAIARGCGSTGWLSSFYALHQFMAGWFSEAAQEEFWAQGPDTLSSTVPGYKSLGEETVAGGVRISGGASFSSGSTMPSGRSSTPPPRPAWSPGRTSRSSTTGTRRVCAGRGAAASSSKTRSSPSTGSSPTRTSPTRHSPAPVSTPRRGTACATR